MLQDQLVAKVLAAAQWDTEELQRVSFRRELRMSMHRHSKRLMQLEAGDWKPWLGTKDMWSETAAQS